MPTFAISLTNPTWRPVALIPCGTTLQKGRRNDVYYVLMHATGAVADPAGCYAWSTAAGILYCESFVGPHGRNASALQGRVNHYMGNHRTYATGFKNMNLHVFENLNVALGQADVTLSVLGFDDLLAGATHFDLAAYMHDHDLVHLVEELLIYTYRRAGQCA